MKQDTNLQQKVPNLQKNYSLMLDLDFSLRLWEMRGESYIP